MQISDMGHFEKQIEAVCLYPIFWLWTDVGHRDQ